MSVRLVVPRDAPREVRKCSGPTSLAPMRDRVEYGAARFLLEHRQRVLGGSRVYTGTCEHIQRICMQRARFDQLARTYKSLIQELLGVKGRLDHLKRSLYALYKYGARRKFRLEINQMVEDVRAELEAREEEEQEMLENIYEVALEITNLPCA